VCSIESCFVWPPISRTRRFRGLAASSAVFASSQFRRSSFFAALNLMQPDPNRGQLSRTCSPVDSAIPFVFGFFCGPSSRVLSRTALILFSLSVLVYPSVRRFPLDYPRVPFFDSPLTDPSLPQLPRLQLLPSHSAVPPAAEPRRSPATTDLSPPF